MGKLGNMGSLVGLTLALAVLDLGVATFAKEWSLRRDPRLLIAGVAAALVLFGVFVIALGYGEMSTVTLGWIVSVQAGLMLMEHVRYGIHHPAGHWVVVGVIVTLQGYLLVTQGQAGS
jgi:hypothetical protein